MNDAYMNTAQYSDQC